MKQNIKSGTLIRRMSPGAKTTVGKIYKISMIRNNYIYYESDTGPSYFGEHNLILPYWEIVSTTKWKL